MLGEVTAVLVCQYERGEGTSCQRSLVVDACRVVGNAIRSGLVVTTERKFVK